jgi:hypothetical protein
MRIGGHPRSIIASRRTPTSAASALACKGNIVLDTDETPSRRQHGRRRRTRADTVVVVERAPTARTLR